MGIGRFIAYAFMRNGHRRIGRMIPWIIGVIVAAGIGHSWSVFSAGVDKGQGLEAFGIPGRQPEMEYAAGLPGGVRDGRLLYRKGYTSCYNSALLQPVWVAWTLTADHCKGFSSRRDESFMEDLDVRSPRADTYDYNGSGYDRGHMCPAADNKWDRVAMTQSFLMTNICPQNPELNRGDWNEIEQQCRQWAKKYGKVYIACGPVFLDKAHRRIGKHRIPVPDAFFKVVLRTSPDICGIGFICRNTDGNHPKDFYVNSISEVERITGYVFFPKIKDASFKKHASLSDWNYKPERYKGRK